MIGFSGCGKAKNASYPLELTLRPQNKSITCQTRVILEGIRENGMYIYEGTSLIPLLNYIDNSKWFIAPLLTIGNNSINVKAYDNIYHKYTSGYTLPITRNTIDTSKQYKNYSVIINGVDYTDKILDMNIDTDNQMVVDKAEISLNGNYMSDINLAHNNEIVISIDDGFLGVLEENFRGNISNRSYDFRNAEKTTKIIALHKIINALDTTSSLWVSGVFNGNVQQELFNQIGITDVWLFNRYKYSGKRYLNDIKPLEVIKDIAAVQGEIISFDKNNSINMIPDEYLNYPLFEFTEDDILELSIEENTDILFNKIFVTYGEPDEKDKSGESNNALIQDPSTDLGYGFFIDEYLKTKIEILSKFGTIYFAVWDKKILDWEYITDARLLIIHDNDTLNISNVQYEFTLEVLADKKIALTEIVLDTLNINKNSKLQFIVKLEDSNKKIYNPDITIDIQDTILEIQNQINAFDALFTQTTLVGDVDVTLNITDDDPNKELSNRNVNIVYINKQSDVNKQKSNENQDTRNDILNTYEFLYRIPVDECILSTVHFNLLDYNTSYSYLDNVEIVQDENNRELFGKKYIRAVTYSNPRTAYNRIKYIYVLFKTISNPTTISFKFKIYGRKFIDTSMFVDYDSLQSLQTNTTSITTYGELDGGYLISNYLSTLKQTENLAKKLVSIYGYPLTKVTLQLPLLSELRKNIMIKITSPNSDINNYYYIDNISKNFDSCNAQCFLLRTTRLVRNQGIESEYDIYNRNMDNIELSPFMNNLINKNKGIEKGIVLVAHNDSTCAIKIFGTNTKYMKVNVLSGLNVKKNDKVLCALAADNTRVVIAILEKYTDNIKYEPKNEETEVVIDPETELDEGFKETTRDDVDNLTVEVHSTATALWKYDVNTDNLSLYEGVPINGCVAITVDEPVDLTDLSTRVSLTTKDGTAVNATVFPIDKEPSATYIINGTRQIKTPVKGIVLMDINFAFDTYYNVIVKSTKVNPLKTIDQYYKISKEVKFEIKTEPRFHIIGVKVLNTNMYEVLLSHPLPIDFKLETDNYLVESLIEDLQ